jgi:hypothetical protein
MTKSGLEKLSDDQLLHYYADAYASLRLEEYRETIRSLGYECGVITNSAGIQYIRSWALSYENAKSVLLDRLAKRVSDCDGR